MGKRLRAVRRSRKLKVTDVAERLNKSCETVVGIENGHAFIRVKDLREVCRFLRVPADYMLCITDKP